MSDQKVTVPCPNCGRPATYPLSMQNGGFGVTCPHCRKLFTIRVNNGNVTDVTR